MLNVFLGYACNFNCGYCLQEPEHERGPNRAPRLDAFFEKVIPEIKRQGIREIAYWGGEPLVYWNAIMEIHERLLDEGIRFDLVKFVTNGSLLKEHHVKVLNAWGAYVVVSMHEGFGEPNWDMVAQLHKSSLSFLFRKDRLSPMEWLERVEELEAHYQRPFFPYMHWIRSTDGAAEKWWLGHEDLDEHVAELWELARMRIEGHRLAHGLWEAHLQDWRSKMRPGREAVPMCFGKHQIDIDLDGNLYGCHHTVNDSMKVGTLAEGAKDIVVMSRIRRFVDTKECMACPIKTWCRGNCHLSNTHDVDCRLSKEKHRILQWIDANERGIDAIAIDV
ncbi:hypothetical protein TW86_04005 [Halomonas sp. S2151]|uniref:radical SAM/SPASM domain-containing protein n=1 Tax=Halomonas sp. S2151 TaxID=579478 RepID=UPI0005F9EE93|nr:radical SAM protein [Halomonas sp. S2151]KJZ17425.1 hypothetical protein TW86_04005 [Halomonas sp. S2151]